MPGGWLPDDVAQQVGAAAAMVWLRRRSAYHPTPPNRQPRDQPDLAALPTTVAAVQAALSAEPTAPPAPHDDPAAADAPVVQPAPVAGLPRGTIGFTGPGALAAARGALVTAALAGLRSPDAPPLVITRSALNALIGSATDHATWLPHVRVAATAQDAAAILSQPRTADPTGRDLATSDEAPRSPGQQQPLLIVDEPAQGAAGNWRAAAADTGTTLLLGPSPGGSTWVIDPKGYVTYPDGGTSKIRLCVLDPTAAADLLTVIGHAHSPGTQKHLSPAAARIPRQTTGRKATPQLLSPVTDSRTRHRLEVRVLGQPTVLRDEQPLTIRRTAALQALVFLTVHPNGASSRELVQAIWPGLPTHTLTGRLYTTLSDLRGTFRAADVPTVIEHAEDRYRLNPTLVDADLWRFNALNHDATTAVTDRTTAWKAVTDTYTGELADGHTWPWLQQPREATRRIAIDAYAALAATETDPQQALTWLQRGIRVDPYNAELHQRAITAFATLGDQSAIAALYGSYTRRLAAAGLEPSDELRAVARHLARETLLPGR
ncbi:AfsR/SARP family transcriptional regulator [Micromonospora sp. ZYX-F-536]|uniref:AfsR/SARP family transcriptional regulator n=1 Tax=Micromonospora sp. ZYX-F-536 TaxID=3457629 RepID=UPI00404078D8